MAHSAPRIVGPGVSERIVVADFNGDGKQDFALINRSVVCVYPGRGDFTFDARVELAAPEFPSALVAADFNGDGRMDLAAATWMVGVPGIDIFLNQGGLLFTGALLPLAPGGFDIAWPISTRMANRISS